MKNHREATDHNVANARMRKSLEEFDVRGCHERSVADSWAKRIPGLRPLLYLCPTMPGVQFGYNDQALGTATTPPPQPPSQRPVAEITCERSTSALTTWETIGCASSPSLGTGRDKPRRVPVRDGGALREKHGEFAAIRLWVQGRLGGMPDDV